MQAIRTRNNDLIESVNLAYFHNPVVRDIEALASRVGLNLRVRVNSGYPVSNNIRILFIAIDKLEAHIQKRIDGIHARYPKAAKPVATDNGT